MLRYYVYVFKVVKNKVVCFNYNVRHLEVNCFSLYLYPIDYGDVIQINLDPSMRFEVIPYRYKLETHKEDS